jgi:hypothetical protein
MTRPDWEAGEYLTAASCSLEQNYLLQRLRRHNREMHGWGVLCGLWVVPAAAAAHPWSVSICPGYAIGPYGDEIELIQPVLVNIEDFLWYKPSQFASIAVQRDIAVIAIRYQDWLGDLELIPGGACECSDPDYVEARTGDGYQAGVIWPVLRREADSQASRGAAAMTDMCRPESPTCPPCADSPWVLLASIILPQRGVPITAAMIDNGFRSTL